MIAARRFAPAFRLAIVLSCYSAGASLVLGTLTPAAAAEPAGWSDYAQAGEFAPALAAVERLPRAERDPALREIAALQKQAGAQEAALATLAAIRDDAYRGDVLAQMYGGGIGPASDLRPSGSTRAGFGGGVQPDFDSLIELMSTTIAPETWRDAGGTQGEVKPHAGGVYVDAAGAMKPMIDGGASARLGSLRRAAARELAGDDVRRTSALRKISLSRLERELQLRASQGLPADDAMQALAGLQKIQYVFVYPETGDVVLAGPAGDWYLGRENRLLAVDTDRPVVRLDDFVTLLRREFISGGEFGCSIDPTDDGIRRLTQFASESSKRPLAPGTRLQWTAQLAERLGSQTITISGVDPTSRVAQVLVEADYRMKLLGIGKEESIAAVPNYLALVAADKSGKPPALDLVRWWFTLNYDALLTNEAHDVYELRGQGVKLLGENEFLAATGRRVGTGGANLANQQFAANFTTHFASLAQKYPIYAELQNVFDLALVCSILKGDGVCDRVGWHRAGFMNDRVYSTERLAAPTTVATVANSRELSKTQIIATASGGVTFDARRLADPASMQIESAGALSTLSRSVRPANVPPRGWWWD